jgi:hypothetical protein
MVLLFGDFHHLDMGCFADVSEEFAASIFRVEVCTASCMKM